MNTSTILITSALSLILWNNIGLNPVLSFSSCIPSKRATFVNNQRERVSSWLSSSSSAFIEYVEDDDDEEEDFMLETIKNSPWQVTADMKYTEYNVNRQRDNYRAIRSAGGKETVNDIYVREPGAEIFWFAGKVAHCTGTISLEKAISQQWNIIEQHACRLRSIELGRKFGTLEIWSTAGDSEMDVAYNRPSAKFEKMIREQIDPSIRSVEIGFEGELYVNDEEGFRTLRTDDGMPLKPEISGPDTTGMGSSDTAATTSSSGQRTASDSEMDDIMKMLNDGLAKQQKMEE